MSNKEATARIKINKLLEAAGWRFFAEGAAPANIRLEPRVTLKSSDLEVLGENFEQTSKGFIDFLLLDAKSFPLIVLEAKSEDKNPLVGKEQARKYAKSQNCRFVMLSNGNLHYFWDLARGNPYLITSFPTPDSVTGYQQVTPNPQRLIEEVVNDDYIALTLRPHYQSDAAWRDEAERPGYIQANKLRFLRPYQLKAVHVLQQAVREDKDRFLFEMATGTGKTLTAAAEAGQWDRVIDYVNREIFDKPHEYYSLDKLRKAAAVDRRLTLREILEKVFGLIPRFKSRDELLEEEFAKFVADTKPEGTAAIPAIKTFFKAYATSDTVRGIIENGHFTDLATNPYFSTIDFKAVPAKYRALIPNYIKDYVSLNQFAP